MTRRLAPAFLLGLLVSLLLFWLMQFMILNNQQGLKQTNHVRMVEFIRLKRDALLKTRKRTLPDKHPPQKRPPPPKIVPSQRQHVQTNMPHIDMPNLKFPAQSARIDDSLVQGIEVGGAPVGAPAGQIAVSTDLIPIVRVPPRYPMRAARNRVEGWVKVEFTINGEGRVESPEVVASHPSRIFNRAALRAISKWKFKPKVIAGQPVDQRALQVLQFKLNK